ncbi:MAG: DUF819 family protein [Verrucomicrobia bacterium]|nr:DUF819 family protein [Verrucomicrobiota bacterium]
MLVQDVRIFFENDPVALFIALVAIVAGIYALSELKHFRRIFDILPTVFWVYFVPMLLATFGFFPESSPTFTFIRDYFLPTSLFLLFISVSIPELFKLGRRTLLVMFAAMAAIVLGSFCGVLVVIPFFKSGALPAEHFESLWKGVAALSGSWSGGSANMAAVWESLTGPEKTPVEREIFAAMIAVDVCIAYPWMALLVALAAHQKRINGWLRADTTRIDEVNQRMQTLTAGQARHASTAKFLYMLALGLVTAYICLQLGAVLNAKIAAGIQDPVWKSIFGAYAITIVLVTVAGLGFSMTPVAKLEGYGASKLGYVLLYIVLARIGAQGNLNVIREFPAYLLMGVVWMLVHGLIILVVIKLLRAPLFFGVTASQANVGGPVSAPVVAAAHQPSLAVVGLLMAVVGNVFGTFTGLFIVAPVVHWLTRTFGG